MRLPIGHTQRSYLRSSSNQSIDTVKQHNGKHFSQQATVSLKAIRKTLYLLGLLSLVIVVFMARRLETSYETEHRLNFDEGPTLPTNKTPYVKNKLSMTTPRMAIAKSEDQKKVDAKNYGENELNTKSTKDHENSLVRKEVEVMAVESDAKEDQASVENPVDVVSAVSPKDISMANTNVLVVIISNRKDGIIPTLASIITTSSRPVDVVVIGEHSINEKVGNHFGSRINEFTSLSVKDIENDLMNQGIKPIWTWPDWHTSMDASWKNENTLHVGPWDNLQTHAHELNHIRFYLPHVSVFKNKSYFFFIDDDLLIKKDLGVVAQKTMEDLDSNRGLVCPCNIWMWNSKCFHFEFQSKKDKILSMPSLYGDREVCKTDSESHCVPSNYWDFVKSVLPEGGDEQFAWNFGFSLFALKNWRDLKLTHKYEAVMKESYRLHVFPETSLTFGLGVPYIAFAGAVECWDDENIRVRDGFGFIDWDRFSATFGTDFFDHVDVVHYTGPDKPWVNESRIETRAVDPWLKMMEHEAMPIPKQLPEQPTVNLVTILGGDRSGTQWLMTTLDSHPQICASGEADNPERGFPADILLPGGTSWYPYCSIKRGCSYDFVSMSVKELSSNTTTAGLPVRCEANYDPISSDDPLRNHIERICNFVKRLDMNYDETNIAKTFIDAFINEDKDLLGCGCVRGVKAKGLKVMPEWIFPKDGEPSLLNLNNTKVHGSKIIRLKRRNLWARYKSMLLTLETGFYHVTSPGEKKSQLSAMKEISVAIEHMEWHMKSMERLDRLGDEWAKDHGSDILWVDYEECRQDTINCFKRIYRFIGVDESHTEKRANLYQSLFSQFSQSESSLDFIKNKGEIKELLGINGWDHFMSDDKYVPIQLLTYEEDDLLVDTRKFMGINATFYGREKNAEGHGSRYNAALPLLRNLEPDFIVILNNDRDGRVNYPVGDHETLFKFLYRFRETFEEMSRSHTGAVIVSADSDCCASALTHARPGDYFDENGKRSVLACMSGDVDCKWAGDDKAQAWRTFMLEFASKHSASKTYHPYLDTSLIAGRAIDLIKLIEALDIKSGEDDRAVFTDFMFRNEDKILIDYDQRLFGESRKPPTRSEKGCFAQKDENISEVRLLDTIDADQLPLFMYSPRGLGCEGEFEKFVSPKYPVWQSNGIVMKPILDHIDRVADMKESIVLPPYYGRKPDYSQGPEIPYIIDEEGIWTSQLIRDRTNNATFFWRALPTETLTKEAHSILIDKKENRGRWTALEKAIVSGGFPYFAWYGDFKTCNHKNYDEDSIPLFTTCASAGCTHAFPIPNYMTIIDTQSNEQNWRGVFKEFEREYPWESKKRKVVWRGALSEAEWRDALTSVRWRLAKHVHESSNELYDIGLTSIPTWLTDKIKFNMTDIGGFVKGIKPMTAFQNFMAVLDMDGNSWSSRFGSLLCYNSVVVKVEPKYFDYFFSDLKPWTHYVPVQNDLSDFDRVVAWTLDPRNDMAVKGIIRNANQYCSQRLVRPELATDLLDILESYVRLLDRADLNWQTQWKQKREQMFSDSKLKMINLLS